MVVWARVADLVIATAFLVSLARACRKRTGA